VDYKDEQDSKTAAEPLRIANPENHSILEDFLPLHFSAPPHCKLQKFPRAPYIFPLRLRVSAGNFPLVAAPSHCENLRLSALTCG
jgi:hypothetical protein